jgi:integrase
MRIVIPAECNKSGEDQWLPIHPELAPVFQALPRQGKHLFRFWQAPPEVSRKFTRIAKAAGLKITLHDLRRSFGSRYAAVIPAVMLQRLMRHADLKTTTRFYTNVDDGLAEAILKA